MANTRKKQSIDLQEQVAMQLRRHLPSQRPLTVCVALSGGLDSVVLLHLAAQLRETLQFSLCALHVHHGLQVEADAWADFAQSLCATFNIPCHVEKVVVSLRGYGLEAAAREARWAAYAQTPADVVLLAQHQDDQAETVLQHLLRGAGLRGLAAMPILRRIESGHWILRPLLEIPRSVLLEYAQAQKLSWVEDPSNADQHYTRNRLRQYWLPLLAADFPAIRLLLARTAQQAAEAETILSDVATGDLHACGCHAAFDMEATRQLGEARQRNALRYWLLQQGIQVESRTFAELQQQSHAQDSAMPVLVWRQQAIRCYRGCLYVTPAKMSFGPPQSIVWQGEPELRVGDGCLRFQLGAAEGISRELLLSRQLILRPWLGSLCLQPVSGRPHRTLKNLAQEQGVPPWVRAVLPVLCIDGQPAAVPGYWVDAAFQTERDHERVGLSWSGPW